MKFKKFFINIIYHIKPFGPNHGFPSGRKIFEKNFNTNRLHLRNRYLNLQKQTFCSRPQHQKMGFSYIPKKSTRLEFRKRVSDSATCCRGFRKIRGKSLSMLCNLPRVCQQQTNVKCYEKGNRTLTKKILMKRKTTTLRLSALSFT